MVVTIITCVGLICTLASALGAVRHARSAQRTLAPGAIGWGVVFLLMQAFIAVWSGIGLVQDDVPSALVANIALTGCAAASFNRHAIAT